MTPRDFCAPGTQEPLKAAVHGIVCAGAVVCLGYNALAWLFRRERHLAVNAGLYAALAGFEWRKIQQHRGR